MTATVLFDTDNWIVLTRAPFAYGPFESRAAAQRYAELTKRTDSVLTAWHEPEWVSPDFPPDFGAVWFNGDWDHPFVVGPFYDLADAIATYGAGRDGMAVELDEFPEEDDCPPDGFVLNPKFPRTGKRGRGRRSPARQNMR
jgi:hypothetical protein